ncbi:MAG: permease [Planctomycetes bacterium]|nr:permease [Planctomycetota bacterium]
MTWAQESKRLAILAAVFLLMFFLPVGWERFDNAIMESLHLAKWYAREHVLLCLVPAFFIAGAIGVFVSQASVMKYLGARANKVLAYGVASVSGSVLAVCSCTVLPLFAGIWRMGAGLGPATAFLYSGPAINVLAIILTARILGMELGIARAVGAVGFSIVIGLIMHLIYRKEEMAKASVQAAMPEPEVVRPLWQNALFFAAMVGVLVFANWGKPMEPEGAWHAIYSHKWAITGVFSVGLGLILVFWLKVKWWKIAVAAVAPIVLALVLPMDGMLVMIPFAAGVVGLSLATGTSPGEPADWLSATWTFAKQILPLLFFGVLVAGFLLGRVGQEGIIPNRYVEMLVGSRPDTFLGMTGLEGGAWEAVVRGVWSLWTNLFASVFGAFMYFATLTEVPILQGLIGSGMGKGPALALLLAGPALSLPSMLVIRSIMGTQKTVVYVSLVVVMATISGMIFGAVWG